MLTKGDDYPIHQTPDPVAFAQTDRNFYDRYFFNGYSDDGEVFFGGAMGVYPNLNIIDAAFSVRIGGRQYSLLASRYLNMERMDTFVGPIRVEVLEPLQRLRLSVGENEHGIAADLTVEGRHFPIHEPRTAKRTGARLLQDVTRLTQNARWSGWIEAGGRRIELDPARTPGTRDRSWGVRPVGTRDKQAFVPPISFQVWWYWLPVHFDDRVILFYVNEDQAGKPWNLGFVVRYDDGREEYLHDAKIDVKLGEGTRFPAGGVVTARDEAGGQYRVEVEAGRRFFMTGLGYMNRDWSHGINKGPLAVGYEEIDSDAARHENPYQHVQAFAKVTMTIPDRTVLRGVGCFESIVMGPHDPSGLTSMFEVP